jgi:ferric-dicitrate binding protein FerR (iron transport regulator)
MIAGSMGGSELGYATRELTTEEVVMPATNSGIAPELVYALKRGEDAALEQLFRARSEALRQEAERELNDTFSAARIVERLFVSLWKVRDRFETGDEIDAFLSQALHEAIVRERSRIAAVHRFEETEHVHPHNGHRRESPSPDAQWSHISAAIHAPPPDAEHTANLLADQSRHTTAAHVGEIGERSNWKNGIIIGGVAVALAAALIWGLDRASAGARVEAAFGSPDVRTLTTRAGQRGAVELRDGGSATLGPRSTLQIPPGYGEELRVVRVTGAAQLRAAAGAAQPIEARLGTAPLTVTGTSFSLSAYPDDAVYMIQANDADARVRTAAEAVSVARGQTILIDRQGAVRTPTAEQVDEVLGWTTGLFVVNNVPLRQALAAMQLSYGTDIAVPDQALLDRLVSARAPLTSSRDAIEALEASGNLAFGYDKEQMVFRDAPPERGASRR